MNNTIELGLIGIGTETDPPFTARAFEALLGAADPSENVVLDLHSEGGSVLEGFRMGNAVGEYSGKVIGRVNVAAFSIASYIAARCDEVEIAENGWIMIHNPKSELGPSDDEELATSSKLLLEMKQSMIGAYVAKTGLAAGVIEQMMKDETYLSATEAVRLGFADRIIESSTKPVGTITNHLPALVLACLSKSADKQPAATPKEIEVSTTKPVATAKWIKATYPKASDTFKFRCMEEEMTEEEVASAHAKAMEEENESLTAKVAAMEEELTALRAKAEEDEVTAKAMEEEKEETAKAKSGLAPVARSTQPIGSAPVAQQWNELVDKYVAQGKPRIKAVVAAKKARPDLQRAMVEAAN